MSRPRGRTPSERRWAMDGPSARAVGQTGEPRGPDAGGRTSGGGLSFGDFSLATQRKVTRPSPKGGRNPVEDGVLASCMAKPCHLGVGPHSSGNEVIQPLTLTLSRMGRGDGYRGAMHSAYCTLRLSRWGEGTVTAADYAPLIDPACPGAVGNPVEDGILAPCRRRGMPGWHPPRPGNSAKFRRCRPWLSLPQCAADPGI